MGETPLPKGKSDPPNPWIVITICVILLALLMPLVITLWRWALA